MQEVQQETGRRYTSCVSLHNGLEFSEKEKGLLTESAADLRLAPSTSSILVCATGTAMFRFYAVQPRIKMRAFFN